MNSVTQFDDIAVEAIGRVAILRLNDPKTLNAVSPRMMKAIGTALEHIEAPGNGFGCVVMTGAGRGFCSGANLTTTGPDDILKQGDLGLLLRERFYPVLRRLRDLKMPLLAAVNGPAIGFGLSLALVADIILAARSAFFQLTFSRIGLIPDGGAPWLLPRMIGLQRAAELIFTGRFLSADEAVAWGLALRSVEDDAARSATATLALRVLRLH
jgi:2-(1,2-epoxy-1,2-dihydrophenyl)acetyl-CoA isomerase